MKKRIFLVSLALVLALFLLAPAPALAAKPVEFNASGSIETISAGDVLPAGNSGRWVVHERELCGILSGDINDDFVLTYRANVDENQAGNLSGKLTIGQDACSMRLNGKSQPLELVWLETFNTYLPMLAIEGHWTFNQGARGNGDFAAWFIFIPQVDEQGNVHIGQIVGSALELTGKW